MAREVKTSGRTVYLPDRDEWEETPTEPRLPPGALEAMIRAKAAEAEYALAVEVSGFVTHEIRCSGCGKIATGPDAAPTSPGQYHYIPAPGGWRKCGEWR